MEMVSFIHKSIQEFLAAWYITYTCVPEGNLGVIEEHSSTLEDCKALENVFQFICGLSDDGAVKVLEHLTSVRISDPALDLSKIIPDVKIETDVPLCDVTDEHYRFNDLAKVKDLTQVTHSDNVHYIEIAQTFETVYELLELLDCQHVPLRITKSSEVLTVGDFLRKFQNIRCDRRCFFNCILCFRNGLFQFYITKLVLGCDKHVRLFTETTDICVLSPSENLCPEQSCLKFLTSLQCCPRDQTKALSGLIRNCKHLKRIKIKESGDSVCDILEQVVSPSKCSLEINGVYFLSWKCDLTSAGAVKLARLLPRFNNTINLCLNLSDCCAAAVDTLVSSITHKTLRRLVLSGISLTPVAAAALGRLLPELSSLLRLELTGANGSILQAEEMDAMFGGFNKTLPLRVLRFIRFNISGYLAPFTKSLRFFLNLRELYLDELNMDEHDLCDLLKSLKFIPNLEKLRVTRKPLSHAHCCTAELEVITATTSFTHKPLRTLVLRGISLTPAVAATLGRLLPEMLSLVTLELTGTDGSNVPAEEMEALFGGFNKTLPLYELTFRCFSVSGCLAPLTKSFRFFPNLSWLCLDKLNMDEHDLCGLLESFQFIPNLHELSLSGNPLDHAVTSIVPHFINLPKLCCLKIEQTGSEEDLNYVQETIKQAKPRIII
ncbi:hypothetical protein OS493_015074 [Desmophyllum pertusum]|uniref:Uncharacterized protein n=1 Tax=Desmophyllum pertusum TaxID=174260 RepID=A0A9W9ZPH2_9CNID|nr:hypothetical protein OS493_015074 [Desmophyllum pertusum]